jgi:hypothetical protein
MTSAFPASPKLLKGALVIFRPPVVVPTSFIVFQYNPETLTRNLETQTTAGSGGESGEGSSRNVQFQPLESFQLSIELDAADQLEKSNALAVTLGLHPTLASLELLMYPPSEVVLINKVLALAGSSLVVPGQLPLALLVWGPMRVLPVRVTSLSVNEQAYDQTLNPIHAKVDLGLRTMTERELNDAGAPFNVLSLVNLIAKEGLALANDLGGALEIRGAIPF